MKAKKSIWTTITGGLTSAAPILLSCCKSGACVGVCASPIASLFGISSATMASSPWMSVIEPVLIAISAVSFTVSYYSLYILPKFNCNTDGSCDCAPTEKEKRRTKINKIVFWLGLILSIGFLSYFEYSKYQVAASSQECGTECSAPKEECCADGDSTACAQ
jgi:zona occludens toxin (predicted ATPase)